MSSRNDERDNVFHERASLLANEGYRGFKVTNIKKQWNGVKVTATNDSGKVASGSGETNEEAYQNLIDTIDLLVD